MLYKSLCPNIPAVWYLNCPIETKSKLLTVWHTVIQDSPDTWQVKNNVFHMKNHIISLSVILRVQLETLLLGETPDKRAKAPANTLLRSEICETNAHHTTAV